MGICHSDLGDQVVESKPGSHNIFPSFSAENESDGEGETIVGKPKNTRELYSHIDKLQVQNYERLLKTFENDKQLFILNQLLMCIQFFPNFDKSLMLAKDFKRTKEHELNEKLAKLAPEGVVCGDRRVVLMHGMGEILAQNFIYRPQRDSKGKENVCETFELLYRKKAKTETFTCEGILPLDIFMIYDDFEVCTESQLQDLQENDYSISPSDSPIFRLRMEEPTKQNKLRKGYVGLLLENSSSRPFSPKNATTNDSGTYSTAGDSLDVISEAKSVYTSSYYSEDEDTLSTINMQPGEKLLHRIEKKINQPEPSPFLRVPSLPPRREESSSQDVNHNLKFEGFLPMNYPSPAKRTAVSLSLAGIDESENPRIKIDGPPLTPLSKDQPHNRLLGKKENTFVPLEPQSSSSERPSILRIPSARSPLPIPPDEANFPPRSELQSPTGSFAVFGGRSLTATSNFDNYKQYQDLHDLFMFPRRQKLIIGFTNPEIAPEYLIEEKVDKEDDDFEVESSSSDSDDSRSTRTSSSEESQDYVIRTYLDSSQFSSVSLSDFSLIGTKIGISSTALQHAQVLGTTIRYSVDYKLPAENERDFSLLYTFTPSLHSKNWPQNSLIPFRRRLLRTKYLEDGSETVQPEQYSWPSRIQVESIEGLGCGVIPEGFHTNKPRPEQRKEWRLTFPQGESLLLNTLKHVHWRAYIFMALLFRAFIFPMGPSGVGLEHIRNLIYQMCEQDYIFWNEEESGTQLRAIMERLYTCLGYRHMSNFFISGSDMLRNVPPESSRKVQALLSQIRENPIIYSLYALRNLTCLQSKENIFPIPNLRRLYKILTYPDTDLLYIVNIHLRGLQAPPPDANNNKKKKNKKKKNSSLQRDFIQDGPQIEQQFQSVLNTKLETVDKDIIKKQRRYRKHLQKLEEMEEQERRRQAAKEDTTVIPVKERRKSIDLDRSPVNKFKNLRLVMMMEFFILHFLKMAAKAITFRAFSEATMYTLHVENLCKLLERQKLAGTNMEMSTIQGYKRECEDLRKRLGSKMAEYVWSKLSHLDLPNGTSTLILTPGGAAAASAPSPSPFTFAKRELPTPPPPASSNGGSMRKFESDYGIALPSPTAEEVFSKNMFESELHSEFRLPEDDSLSPRRRQSVAFGGVRFDTNKPSTSTATRRGSLFGEEIMIGAAELY